jgi:hypothetical protein
MRRGRAPTASRAAGGVACPLVLEDERENGRLEFGVATSAIAFD